jgi:hypothetical protein
MRKQVPSGKWLCPVCSQLDEVCACGLFFMPASCEHSSKASDAITENCSLRDSRSQQGVGARGDRMHFSFPFFISLVVQMEAIAALSANLQ